MDPEGIHDDDVSGGYLLALAPGTYRVYFSDPGGLYLPEYFDNKSTLAAATDVGAVALTTYVADADLAPATPPTTPGILRGTVTGGGGPRPGINVYAYRLVGSSWAQAASTVTTSSGGYLMSLPSDTYHVYFSDPVGRGYLSTGTTRPRWPPATMRTYRHSER